MRMVFAGASDSKQYIEKLSSHLLSFSPTYTPLSELALRQFWTGKESQELCETELVLNDGDAEVKYVRRSEGLLPTPCPTGSGTPREGGNRASSASGVGSSSVSANGGVDSCKASDRRETGRRVEEPKWRNVLWSVTLTKDGIKSVETIRRGDYKRFKFTAEVHQNYKAKGYEVVDLRLKTKQTEQFVDENKHAPKERKEKEKGNNQGETQGSDTSGKSTKTKAKAKTFRAKPASVNGTQRV